MPLEARSAALTPTSGRTMVGTMAVPPEAEGGTRDEIRPGATTRVRRRRKHRATRWHSFQRWVRRSLLRPQVLTILFVVIFSVLLVVMVDGRGHGGGTPAPTAIPSSR
jgi:hypothetical protein